MKWYWAVLLTLVILAATAGLGLLLGDKAGQALGQLLAGVFAVWVAAESGSFGWGLVVLCFWPIAFPWFLIKKYQPQAEVTASERRERLGDIVA